MKNKVTLYQVKNKSYNQGVLSKELKKAFDTQALTFETKFESKQKNKLLRRVVNVINNKPGFSKTLPIEITQPTDKNGLGYVHRKTVNVLATYKSIARDLNKEGFVCKVKKESYKLDGSYYHTVALQIDGLK